MCKGIVEEVYITYTPFQVSRRIAKYNYKVRSISKLINKLKRKLYTVIFIYWKIHRNKFNEGVKQRNIIINGMKIFYVLIRFLKSEISVPFE